LYAHFLFEHAADLDFDRSAAMEIAGSTAAADPAALMAVLGLDNTTLVSLNWMVVSGVPIFSRATDGGGFAVLSDRCELHCLASISSNCAAMSSCITHSSSSP
jgi:hypothetical protein